MTATLSEIVERHPRRFLVLMGIAAVGLGWCAVLGALVWTSSNPVVLNRTQISAADVVVQGEWLVKQPAQLRITRVWKGAVSSQAVALTGRLPVALPTGEILVPLSRIPVSATETAYQVTQGLLENQPAGAAPDHAQPGVMAEVQPLVYPATPEALAQLAELLRTAADDARAPTLIRRPETPAGP